MPRIFISYRRADSQDQTERIHDQPLFSPNGTLLVVAMDGLYDVATGTRLFRIDSDNPVFSPDTTLLAVNFNSSKGYCALYGANDNVWQLRMGFIHTAKTNIRQSPSSNAPVLRIITDDIIVIGRTSDNQWYKVIYDDGMGWVATSAVIVVAMPDALPVITP